MGLGPKEVLRQALLEGREPGDGSDDWGDRVPDCRVLPGEIRCVVRYVVAVVLLGESGGMCVGLGVSGVIVDVYGSVEVLGGVYMWVHF